MEPKNSRSKRSLTLYDAGGWFLITMVFGVYLVGVIIDYFWNYLVIWLSLRWLRFEATKRRKLLYCIAATVCGLVIDWLYYQLTWGVLVVGEFRIEPLFRSGPSREHSMMELVTVLVPMAAIGVVNFLIARPVFKLKVKQALVLGGAMAVFTAPWLIVAFVMLNW